MDVRISARGCQAARQVPTQHQELHRSGKKKYTDIQELDATILREFIERIKISPKDKATKMRQVRIVSNFIGAFDFNMVKNQIEPVETGFRQRKVGNG
jgi:hypothetical protein